MKSAMALIMLCVTISPATALIGELLNSDLYEQICSSEAITVDQTEFSENAERAYCRGIERFVSSEFSLSEDNVSVVVFGFDSINMKAQKIKVILSGSAAFTDYREVADRLYKNGFNNCEVEIDVR